MIYVDCEHREEALSAVPGRRGPVFPIRLHLLRLHYDPVMGTRGGDEGTLGLKLGTNTRLQSDSLAQTSVLPVGTWLTSVCYFTRAFPGKGIIENKI